MANVRYFYFPCRRSEREMCIGIARDNWAFCLYVDNVKDLPAWKEKFKIPGSRIENSSGDIVSPEEMEMIITFRRATAAYSGQPSTIEGPHGLIRRRIGREVPESKCIANEDCWDLCLMHW